MSKLIVKMMAAGALAVTGATVIPVATADQASCGTANCTTGNVPVNFSIAIPAVLRLQVGAVGATAQVDWTAAAITATNVGNGTAVNADSVANGGAGAGLVAYSLVSNISNNNATITATGSGAAFDAGGGNTIPYTAVNATAVPILGAAVALPVPGTPTTVSPVGGLILRTGTWQYNYVNTTIYAAGTYTGTINYTANQP
jgi:hypothetical protein